ncbi:hypothetical protein B0J11DRAFT_531217 [Dendryphion nanum]|uniref:Uncharacterized protein n=1 Tax=Dendryphion nanum TaxID=256645 RepID=A0A9P9IK99_9PLEO|nr:hypothetical protein B0J11DRAFT_531217 [Dendryphion nanum]
MTKEILPTMQACSFALVILHTKELVQQELGDQNRDIHIPSEQLCQFLAAAESIVRDAGSLGKHSIASGVKKRKRLKTPPEEIASDDEVRYVEQERKMARRIEA